MTAGLVGPAAAAPTDSVVRQVQEVADEEVHVGPHCFGNDDQWLALCLELRAGASVAIEETTVYVVNDTQDSISFSVQQDPICPFIVCTPSVDWEFDVPHPSVTVETRTVEALTVSDPYASTESTSADFHGDNVCEDLGIDPEWCPLRGSTEIDLQRLLESIHMDNELPTTHLVDANGDGALDGLAVDATPGADEPTLVYANHADLAVGR